MLLHYTPFPGTLQNHIHLGAVPYSGSPSGFGGHGEPPYKFGHIEKRLPTIDVVSNFQRSIDGTPFEETLRTTSKDDPVVFENVQYGLRVTYENFRVLVALSQRRVYLVDSWHCADTSDHTPYVKIMYFQNIVYNEFIDPLLNNNEVTINLIDMNTIAGL